MHVALLRSQHGYDCYCIAFMFTSFMFSILGWKYSKGFVSEQMIKDNLFPPSSSGTLTVMCGPPPMINYACIPNLDKLGYDKDMYFAYQVLVHTLKPSSTSFIVSIHYHRFICMLTDNTHFQTLFYLVLHVNIP